MKTLLSKAKKCIRKLNFSFYKVVVIWLLFVVTVLLFIEADRLHSLSLFITACTNLILGINALTKELNFSENIENEEIDGGE